MEKFIKWIEDLNRILKFLLVLVEPVYFVYRLFKCITSEAYGKYLVYAILLLVFSYPVGIIIDIICIAKNGRPSTWFLA